MSFYLPFSEAQLNILTDTFFPVSVKARNNRSFAYWERALLQRAMSVFESNLPEIWTEQQGVSDFLWYNLFYRGYVAVFDSPEYGICFQPVTLSGMNFYYQPVKSLVSNPYYQGKTELVIGEDCELLRLTPDYMGAWDCIAYAAEKLSSFDNAVNMSIINNKFAFFLAARNKACAAALQKMLDLVNRGEPAVVVNSKLINDQTDKEEPWQFWERDLNKAYITDRQLQDQQTILNNFDTEIGIPSVPYQKKERMVTSEAESKMIDATARSSVWIRCLKESAGRINDKFGLDLSFDLRFDPDEMGEEGTENGTSEPDSDRAVS